MSNSHLNRPADLAKVGDSTRGLAWAGFVLICGAFAMPVIGEWLGARTEVVLVQWVGEQLGALLVLGCVLYFATRNRSERAWSIGVFVVGSLMCLAAYGNFSREARAFAEAQTFVRKVLAFQHERETVFLELKQRVDRFDLTGVLGPEAMSTAVGREQARAKISEYRALLAERERLLESHGREAEKLFQSQAPEAYRERALETVKRSVSDVATTYHGLARAQSAQADEMAEAVEWFERRRGEVKFFGQRAEFATPAVRAEYNVLAARLAKRESALDELLKSAEAQFVHAKVDLDLNRVRMQDFIREP